MKKGWKIFWHTLFWTALIACFVFLAHSGGEIAMASLFVLFVVFGIINITLFYVNYLVLIPRYFDNKKYKGYFGSVALAIIVFGLIKYGVASQCWDCQ